MPKFNPHPLFPENPLYEIHSEAEIPHSDRYELWCDGRRQTVYHTDSFDYAVVVRKNSEHFPVEIHVSTAFKDVVIRPLSVGVSFEREEDVIRFTLPGPVKISVELDGNLKTPLFILTTNYVAPPDPAPAYFFRKGHVYDMVKLYPTTTFSEACNIGDGYYKDENGQFQWAPADTRTLDALKKYQELYQEGILDPEFYSYTRYQGAQKFYVQGTSGLTLEDGHAIMITYIRNGLAEQGLDPDEVLHLAQLVGDDGMYHYREDSNYWGQVMFSPTISQEKFERAMDILDYTCTEEGQNFMNMGFEGIDWELDESGNYVSLLDPSIQGSATSVLGGKYPSKESSFGGLILTDDFSLVSPNYSYEIQNTVRDFYKLREELSDKTTLLPREYEYEFLSSREKSQATMDLGDEYAKLILKDGELEDNWNTWVEEKMAVVQPVLDQLNK